MDAVRIRQIETHSSCVGDEPLKNIKKFHCSSYAQGFARILAVVKFVIKLNFPLMVMNKDLMMSMRSCLSSTLNRRS